MSPVFSCDSYTLPPLAVGNYFTASYTDSTRVQLYAGQQITTTQTIYVYAENVNTRFGICRDEESLVVTVSQTPILPNFSPQSHCGSYTLPPLAIGNYFTEPDGQGNQLNAGDIITSTQTIHVYAEAPNNPLCYDKDDFLVTIYPSRILNINKGVICYDYTTNQIISSTTLFSGVNPNEFTVNWSLNNQLVHTGPSFTPTQHGIYTVSTIKINPEGPNDCNYVSTQVIVERSSPIVATIIYNEAFTTTTFIEVIVKGGYGTYEYQLNNGPFQSSTRFENLASGYYTVTIKDTKGGCNSLVLKAYIINYPKFFTPNNDGFNDNWNITDLFTFKEAKIHIYDRYGKFLKEIFPFKAGWDGRYNNQDMPSSDYWFVV
jgi:gliding motility-associated-like protein